MKKLLYLGFCVALAMAFGCAITNYGTIVDNDQGNGSSSGVISTNGKAHITESSQIGTLVGDGVEELINFVDQKGDGTAKLTTYNNFSSFGAASTFHDDFYCNPDWNGCAVFTAPDNNDGNIFDGVENEACGESLSVLLSTGRYYGECGRSKVALRDRLTLLGEGELQARFGEMGLFYNLNATNTSVWLDNNQGVVSPLNVRGSMGLWVSGERKVGILDATNPLVATTLRSYANWLSENGSDHTTVNLCLHGVCTNFEIGGNTGVSNASRILNNVNNYW